MKIFQRLYLFSSIGRFLMDALLQLALPLTVPLQLSFPSGPVAFGEVSALLATIFLMVVPCGVTALLSGFDVLFEGDHWTVAAVGPRALSLPHRKHGLQAGIPAVVGRLLAIQRLLQHGYLLFLRLLNGLFWNVSHEDEEAILAHSALDQSAKGKQP